MKISELGLFALKQRLGGELLPFNAIPANSGIGNKIVSTEIFLEGIHFNLIYSPLKHLGYKVVSAVVSDIVATDGKVSQIHISVGVSTRFSVEDMDDLFKGIHNACSKYGADLVETKICSSMTGLTIAATAVGESKKACGLAGAQVNDLICTSGDLGAAYMGLQVLERERRVFESSGAKTQPKLEGYDYVLERQLYPEARTDMVDIFRQAGVVPTSMTVNKYGLASAVLGICNESKKGARIYIDKIPIASETFKVCDEMSFDAITAVMNGGDDYELLFTLPLSMHENIKSISGFEIIGHITEESKGAYLCTPDGNEIELKSREFYSEN